MQYLSQLSLRTKLFFAFFLLTAFITMLISLVLFVHMRTNHLDTLKRDLVSITTLAAMQMEDSNLEAILNPEAESALEYQKIQQFLQKIIAKEIGITEMYIVRQNNRSGQWINVVDGKAAGSDGQASVAPYKNGKIPAEAYRQSVVMEEDAEAQVINIKAYTPLRNWQGGEIAILVTVLNGTSVTQDFQHFAWRIFSVAVGAVTVAAMFSWWLARNFSRRLINLHSALNEIAAGKLNISLVVDGSDEVAVLAERINSLAVTLHGEREEMLLAAIESLVAALEAKDTYTYGHSSQVSVIVLKIAQQMGLQEKEKFTIQFAALLHDIGKIGIPDQVLNKPGRPTEDEWEMIKQHPVIGAKIIAGIPTLGPVAEIVKHHHARWDGHGYPDSLAGQEIPLGSRIIAVADTFQAMTSDRSYRKGLSIAVAMREIQQHAGTQFDVTIVTAFAKIYRECSLKSE